MGQTEDKPKTGAYNLEGVIPRRLLPEFEENPSIKRAADLAKTGTRRIPNKTGDKCLIVNEEGEILAPAGFHEVVEVDQTKFVKMYVDTITIFNDLSKAGSKVFDIVYRTIRKNPNTDTITLHHKLTKMAKNTFDRGLTELINKEIIYKSVIPSRYFININYMFNGDRYALIKEYRLKAECNDNEKQGNLPL